MTVKIKTPLIAPQSFSGVGAVILAAGRGTRMNATLKNKVAYHLNGQPMIAHTVANLRQAGITEITVVVGFKANSVRLALGDSVKYAEQLELLGTGDALKTALPTLSPDITTVLSVYGDDSAFYPPALYREFIQKKISTFADILVLTIDKADPTGLGRIVRDSTGKIVRIVEEKNATQKEKKITEINTGFYCFDRDFLTNHIDLIKKNPVNQEYYLTDLIEIAQNNGKKVEAHLVKDASIWHGINTRDEYNKARVKYRREHHV